MKTNLPITKREVELLEGQTIVTKTDMKGMITYANEDFCEISGFSTLELIGKNHNLVRHPDMPEEAFEDLWRTLQNGKPWSGLVKNRRRNGDYYWVKAFVAPIHDNQVVVGYVSSRIRPSRDEVRAAEKLYRDMKEGRCNFILREGKLVPRNLLRRLNPFRILGHSTVGKQLATMSLAFLLGSLLAGAMAFLALEQVKVNGPIYARVVQGKDLVADVLPPPEYLVESWLTTLEMTHAKPEELPKLIDAANVLRRDYESRHEFWKQALVDGNLKTKLVEASYKPAMAFLDLRDQQLIPALRAGDQAQVEQLLPTLRAHYVAHRAAIDQVVSLANARVTKDEYFATREIQQRYLLLAMSYGALFALVGILGWFIIRTMTRQLGGEPGYARDIANHIAAGNLGMYVITKQRDEASLLGAIKLMQEKLQYTISHVQSNAESVAVVAKQLSESAMHVRASSTEQSESAANIASISEEMTTSVANVAENATQARSISASSEAVCRQGAEVVHNAVLSMEKIAQDVHDTADTMTRLGEQSVKIASVVKTIREIADQTNLLALNAAIEAARAGEHGRGFSVVADEVRNLAERTTVATQDIAGVIAEIQTGMQNAAKAMKSGVERVNEGTALANEAGSAIEKIQQSANHVVKVVTEISQAMDEQRLASENVATHIERIADMSGTNSTAASESATAAQQLESAAKNLATSLNRFAV